MPASFGKPITAMGTANNTLMALASGRSSSTARAASGSPTGIRNIAQHVDDLAVIRSCWADGLNHVGSVCQMNTGDRFWPAGRRWARG